MIATYAARYKLTEKGAPESGFCQYLILKEMLIGKSGVEVSCAEEL